jgi:hypothetical protein
VIPKGITGEVKRKLSAEGCIEHCQKRRRRLDSLGREECEEKHTYEKSWWGNW